jgi:hypothetical protein
VSADSATIEGWQTPRTIHANHMDMTRFVSDEDPGYKAFSAEISRWIESFETPIITPAMLLAGRADIGEPIDLKVTTRFEGNDSVVIGSNNHSTQNSFGSSNRSQVMGDGNITIQTAF